MPTSEREPNQITLVQSLDRARATYAYDCAARARDSLKDRGEAERYRSLAEKLPALIQTNGLGATLAFLASKSAKGAAQEWKAEGRLAADLCDWLTRTEWPTGPYSGDPQSNQSNAPLELLRRLTSGDARTYRRAALETLALASWLKRLSAALIENKRDE